MFADSVSGRRSGKPFARVQDGARRQRALFEQLEPRLLLDGALPAFAPVTPAGSMIYHTSASDQIDPVGDADSFTFQVDRAATVSVQLRPSAALRAKVQVFSGLDELASASADQPGRSVILTDVELPGAGTYLVKVTGLDDTSGAYGLDLWRGASLEIDAEGGSPNDSLPRSQDISGSFIDLTDSAKRAAVHGSLPFLYEDFEDGALGAAWTTWSSDPAGRIRITGDHSVGRGDYSLWMDSSGGAGGVLNEAVWQVNLAGADAAYLHFSHAEYGDEQDPFGDLGPAGAFTGHRNADGIAISDDGVTWYPIWDAADQPYVEWQHYTIDLLDQAQQAGISLGPTFYVKFQQFDDGSISSDGRGWDDIYVSSQQGDDSEDWYSFTLHEEGYFTAALAPVGGAAVQMQLYYSVDSHLCEARPVGTNIGSVIEDYFVSPGEYYIRVTGAGEYNLLVTAQSTFDIQPNWSLDEAQDVTATGTALGAISGGETHYYAFEVRQGDELEIETRTPLSDTLDVQVELFDSGGTLLATDRDGASDGRNALLSYTAAADGTLYVAVSAEDDSTGQYVVQITGATGELPDFHVLSTTPLDGEVLMAAPDRIIVQFSSPVALTTLEARDLSVDGIPATDFEVVDFQTVAFDLPRVYGEGFHVVRIEQGKIYSAQNLANESYSGTFKLGESAPRVTYCSIQEGKTLPSGELTFVARFDSPLAGDTLDEADVMLVDSTGAAYAPDAGKFDYDEQTWTLTVGYSGLAQGAYTLTLRSGDGMFEDVAGADLDGEVPRWPSRFYESGDGEAGGDFVVHFNIRDLEVARPEEMFFGSGTPAIFHDADGDLVTVRLTGPGEGKITFAGPGPGQQDARAIELFGTTAASTFSISVAGSGTTTFTGLYVHGRLGAIRAADADMLGSMWVEGGLGTLVLGDLPGDHTHTIELNSSDGALPDKLRLRVVLGSVADCELDTGGIPILSLSAQQWQGGSITAPWIRDVNITGSSRRGLRGDFGADITLDDADDKDFSLRALQVAGVIGDSNVDAASGNVKLVAADQWEGGSLSARVLETLQMRGDRNSPLVNGDFGADLNLSGGFFAPWSLRKCLIRGGITGGSWSLSGYVPQVRAAYTSDDWSLSVNGVLMKLQTSGAMGGTINCTILRKIQAGGDLTASIGVSSLDAKAVSILSLSAASARDARIFAIGGINSVRVYEWLGGSLQATCVKSFKVTGKRSQGIAGDCTASLNMTGAVAMKNEIGSALIAGDVGRDDGQKVTWKINGAVGGIIIKGSTWNWSLDVAGGVGSLKLPGLDDSEITAGWINSMNIDGDLVRSVVTADSAKPNGTSVVRLNVKGLVKDSTLDATGGVLGSLNVGRWDGGELTAAAVGNIKTSARRNGTLADGSFDAAVDVVGNIRSARINGDLSGSWIARSIGSLNVGGNMTDTTLTLGQTSDARQPALGMLNVSGWIDSCDVAAPGNFGTILAGGVRDSTFFAGVQVVQDLQGSGGAPDDVPDLPDPASDIYLLGAGGARIGTINITARVSTAEGDSVLNSNFAAARIGSVKLAYAKTDNDDVPFGIAADEVGIFAYLDHGGTQTYKNLLTAGSSLGGGAWDDLVVRIV